MQISNIPTELKTKGLWCNWRLTDRGKIPINSLTGEYAKSNDKSTFNTFDIAFENLPNFFGINSQGQATGGLGLGIFNGFSAIDIDHCVDDNGEVSDLANDIIEYCGSYTEFSPSGRGIRIIFKTNTKLNKSDYYINNQKLGLEIYISDNTHKFVTITGDVLYMNSIAEIDITYILDKYMRKKKTKSVTSNADFDINNINDKKLHDLWNATAPGSGANENELDLALCSKLAYYLKGDRVAVDTAFRSSPYYMSKDDKHIKKWEVREDYREKTLDKAVTNTLNMSVDKPIEYGLNDTGNARTFINRFGDKVRYNVDNKKWMIWNGEYWQSDEFNHVKNLAELTIEEMRHKAFNAPTEEERKAIMKNVQRALQRSGKEALLKEAEHIQGVGVTNNDFDKDDWVINTKSGIVDLKSGKIIENNKDLMISKYIPHEISFAKPKRWLKFLDEIFEKDKDVIHYVHKAMGYSLTGSTKEEVMFILLGDGNNGKSVLLETFNEALGDYGGTSNVDILIEKKYGHGENKGEIARLKGMRQIVVEEPALGDKLDESAIKTMTSASGKIVARFLYSNEFEFVPKFKIWMSANHKPIIRGTDNGIWRRMILIKFNRIFKGKEIDRELKFKLKEEIPQILGWMIQGCMLWQKEGLEMPKVLEREKKEYRSEMDIVQRWIDENCVEAPNSSETSRALFENFSEYVKINKEYQLTHTMFGRNMSKKFKKRVIYGVTKYYGIRINRNKNILTDKERDEI